MVRLGKQQVSGDDCLTRCPHRHMARAYQKFTAEFVG